MENKYKEKARELLWKSSARLSTVDLMCKMAEEVVKESELETNDILRDEGIFTKKQVEELFKKNKELLLENTLKLVYTVDYSVWNNYTVTDAIYDAFKETKLKID